MLAGRAAQARGYNSLRAYPGIVRSEVDDWVIEIHAQDEDIDGLLPFVVRLTHRGWLAGLVWVDGGTIADGSVANEAAFCDAARAALRPSTNGAHDR